MSSEAQTHRGQPLLQAGAALEEADAAVVMLHGRGADAGDILALSEAFGRPALAYLAPQAANNTWYPQPFMAPVADNEPWRTSALELVADVVGMLITHDIPPAKTAILGFSQGACLALEFAARHPDRYGAIVALTGGLIGESIAPGDYAGSLERTPVFIGSSDVDPYIPIERVKESVAIMEGLDAAVVERIYPGMGHSINEDEVSHIQAMLAAMASPREPGATA